MTTVHYITTAGLLAMAAIAWSLARDYRRRRDADRALSLANARSPYRSFRRLGWPELRAMRQVRANGFDAGVVIDAAVMEDAK